MEECEDHLKQMDYDRDEPYDTVQPHAIAASTCALILWLQTLYIESVYIYNVFAEHFYQIFGKSYVMTVEHIYMLIEYI